MSDVEAAVFLTRILGQALDWQRQHKRICKYYNRYIASGPFQALAPHEKLDALLLSHLAAHISSEEKAFEDESSPLNTFMSLLPGPATQDPSPPACGIQKALTPERLDALYSRFGNNNFVIHSHLTTFGHGIFPLASRLFNHSCMPNAAAKYQLQQSQLVKMEIVALRDILPDEEVTVLLHFLSFLQSCFSDMFTLSRPSTSARAK